MYSGGTRYFVTDGLQLTPGKWITYSFSVAEMNMQANSSRHNVATTTGLVIRWEEKAGPTKIFYIDNFRMEFSDK